MADWYIKLFSASDGVPVGEYSLQTPYVEVRNSEVGNFSGELALSQWERGTTVPGITRDQFAPYRTNFEIWRQSTGNGVCVTDGMVTSINLNGDRDTILISGQDWKHYLERRIYPFSPADYVTYNPNAPERYWDKYPKHWPYNPNTDPAPDLTTIVRDLLLSMRTGVPVDAALGNGSVDPFIARPTAWDIGVPDITWNLSDTGVTIPNYKIYPADTTSIYEHIQKLSEMSNGFEWDILPVSHEFKLWSPSKYTYDLPVYYIAPDDDEANGAVIQFDWTNDGPDGTWLIGLGTRQHKVGAVWTTETNREQFGRYDLVYDYGELSPTDVILQKLKDQNDLWPQKKLSLTLLNPEFADPNFYTGGRPRSVLANTIRVTKDFPPYHKVDAYFQVNAIKWSVDESTNESVELELMMIYEPNTGSSGGIPLRTQ